MATLQDINKANLEAMKSKDSVARALFSTLKGSVETELKKSTKSESEIIESLAKKFTENAKLVNTEESNKEIELLKQFLPSMLDNSLYKTLANTIISSNMNVVEEIKNGNPNKTGLLVGMFMKQSKIDYPGITTDAALVKLAIDEALKN